MLPALPPNVFAAAIPNLKNLVGRIADRFFNWPSSHLRIAGITGTNGKTTCAYCWRNVWNDWEPRPLTWAPLAGDARQPLRSPRTRRRCVTVHRTLAQLRASGVREVAMEVSSHALDQAASTGCASK